MRITVKLL